MPGKVYKGKAYADKKCFFRCLAVHNGAPLRSLERAANKLLRNFCDKGYISNFNGICLEQMEDVSRIFNTSINVYEQDENRNTSLIYRTTLESGRVLNLNLYEDHFSFVKDLNLYSNSYRCHKCDKIWSHSGHFHRHVRTCDASVKDYYSSGNFSVKPSIFDELSEAGINIPGEMRNYPYIAAFDIEWRMHAQKHEPA